MKTKSGRWMNSCVLHAYHRCPVMQVRDTLGTTVLARICRRCGHCHSGDWQHARDMLNDARSAGLSVEALPCITREVHRPVVVLTPLLGGWWPFSSVPAN